MEFDFIIIGAGSAGCVLAERLSADPANSVLLLESGPADRHPFIDIPRAVPKLLTPNGRHVWTYAVSPGRNRPNTIWLKGKGLGGSSSVNGMVYVRGHPADYDGWKALGCEGWGWDEMAPCFAALENHELGGGGGRGTGGPLRVTMQPSGDPLCEAVLDAAAQAGTERVEDSNDAPHGGFGYQPRTIWRGRRQSAAKAFLRPALRRPNLEVMTDSDALRLCFSGRRANEVVIRRAGRTASVRARREIIVSAGAIASPRLLQLSGIGDGRLLSGLGVPVLVDNPEVGRNLQDHFNYKAKYRVTSGSLNQAFRGLALLGNLARYLVLKDGPMSRSTWELGGFLKTRADLSRPDAQVGVGLYSMGTAGVDPFPGLTFSGYLTNPASRGELRITSANPDAPLFIDANFLGEAADREASIALIRQIRRIAAQPALAPFIAEELLPGAEAERDEDILACFVTQASTAFHVAGTCRMGSDADSVVDPHLCVRGVEGLRVVDTSIFPTLVSGNTNAPAMATAWRAAHRILQNR